MSQMVGVQATVNVLTGGRYKNVSKEIKAYVKGEYGRAPGKIDPEVQKLVLGDEKPITQRYADLLEPGFEKAKRELGEECGLTADNYISLGQFYPTVGYDTEVIYTWVATGLHKTQMHLDADEFLTPDRVPLEKAYQMVMSGEIKDGKTIAGVLKLKALLDEGKL